MTAEGKRRLVLAVSGAILGGLLSVAFDKLGFYGILKWDVSPLLWLVPIGAIVGTTRARPALWIANGLALLVIVVASYTPVSSLLIRGMVRRDALPARPLDALVVLSGGATADNMMSNPTLDRLLSGVALSKAGRAGALVLSRETFRRHGRTISDSADQAGVLALADVTIPVFYIDSAKSTRDEALRVKRLAAGKSWSRIGLVTSPLHSRRACGTFEAVGFAVTCLPGGFREGALSNLDDDDDRMRAFKGWFYEFAGTTKYRMSGWLR